MDQISSSDITPAIYNSSSHVVGSGETNEATEKVVSLVMELLFATFFVAGVLGNITVLYFVSKYSKLKSVTNFYIVNLASSDLLLLLGIPFIITTYKYEYWVFGNITCKLYMVNTSLNQFTSSLFLTIMSADRYVAICHSMRAPRYRTALISRTVALSAWLLAALMTAPVVLYAEALNTSHKISCNIFWPNSLDGTGTHMFIVYSFILSFLIPLTLIFSFFFLLFFLSSSFEFK